MAVGETPVGAPKEQPGFLREKPVKLSGKRTVAGRTSGEFPYKMDEAGHQRGNFSEKSSLRLKDRVHTGSGITPSFYISGCSVRCLGPEHTKLRR